MSYVVASYNHVAYVEDAIRSIRNQQYSNLELVVIDDGSTDGTIERLAELLKDIPWARLVRQSNNGVVHARNHGVQLASGKYISIIDSDDAIPLSRTSRLVEALEGQPSAVLAYGDVSILASRGAVKGLFSNLYPVKSGEFSDSLFLHYCFVPAASVMFRRDAFLQSGPFWGPGPPPTI